MAIQDLVIKGKQKKPYCFLFYGPDGVGKTSVAAQAPRPIFLGPELGTSNIDVDRFPSPDTWQDFVKQLGMLIKEDHGYHTLVIDSLDWLEPILYKNICEEYNVKSIELAAGGWGKAYTEALTHWNKIKDACEILRNNKGMNIALIAHSEVVNFTDPATQMAYHRYELKLHKRSSAMWREYVDAVLFCNFETHVKKEGKTNFAFSDGARVFRTERRPGWDAKNRFGLPLKIDLSWSALVEEIERPHTIDSLRDRIKGMIESIDNDDDLKRKAQETFEKAGSNIQTLQLIANRLSLRLADV